MPGVENNVKPFVDLGEESPAEEEAQREGADYSEDSFGPEIKFFKRIGQELSDFVGWQLGDGTCILIVPFSEILWRICPDVCGIEFSSFLRDGYRNCS